MIQFNKDILVPVDFKQPSINAIRMALKMAPFVNGKVHLLHVIPVGGILSELLESKSQVVNMTTSAMEKLNHLNDLYFGPSGIDTTVKVEPGKPYRKILEYAASIDPSIILIGDNDQIIDDYKILGSTNTHIITHSRWPVITFKGEKPTPPSRIVLPVDLSGQSQIQLCNAIAMAKHYESTIYLVSVVIGGISARESRIYKIMKQFQSTIRKNKIPCEIKLYKRSNIDIYQRIIEYANEISADLIMIMTHQESTTHDNFIGAVAHHVINEASMPVLSLTFRAAFYEPDQILSFVDPLNVFSGDVRRSRKTGLFDRMFRKE
jgi:nucleotide-binding universal stress UspA family protein